MQKQIIVHDITDANFVKRCEDMLKSGHTLVPGGFQVAVSQSMREFGLKQCHFFAFFNLPDDHQ